MVLDTQDSVSFTPSRVDGLDFLTWQRNYLLGGQVDNSNGDANLSGTVDDVDEGIWESQLSGSGMLGMTTLGTPAALPTTQVAISPGDTLTFLLDASGVAGFNPAATFAAWDVIIREITFPFSAATAAPEPSTLLLSIFACLGGAIQRRRRR